MDSASAQDFPLPRVAQALSPYIKTRQEVQRIRQILSLYVARCMKDACDQDQSLSAPGALAVPNRHVEVLQIPSELTGFRKDYLKALQKNAKARRENTEISKELDRLTCEDARQEEHRRNAELVEAATTLHLLDQQKAKHEKLQIILDYITLLAKKDVAKPGFMDRDVILGKVGSRPESSSIGQDQIRTKPIEDDTTPLLQLKMAVLRARSAAEKEKRLLYNVRSKYDLDGKDGIDQSVNSKQAKVFALSQTRDELIRWIEEALAKGSQSEDAISPASGHNGELVDIDQHKKSIEKVHTRYLKVRSLLNTLVSQTMLHVPELNTMASDTFEQKHESESESEQVYDTGAARILPYVVEHLKPTAEMQESIVQVGSYTSHRLGLEKQATTRLLDRLADESSLLRNYPLQAADDPFQRAIAASENSPNLGEEASGALRQAQSWAFAAGAAKLAREEAVAGCISYGTEQIRSARVQLMGLKDILGADEANDESGQYDAEEAETQRGPGNKSSKSSSANKIVPPRGIWAGLDGKVGCKDSMASSSKARNVIGEEGIS
ncbi:MAG: hypothetical protein LQ351_000466 [Letrouitia transgressa]|nr:MAG: hypothetical protein LQ351_000466 [Letrouitia transgressa]